MPKSRKSNAVPSMLVEDQKWIEEHVVELKQQYVLGHRLLYQSLLLAFVVGLAAHIGGFILLSSQPNGLQELLADLLYALGWSLWTGVVVAVFVQVLPEVKRRQIRQAVEAFEASRRMKRKPPQKGRQTRARKRQHKQQPTPSP